MRLLHGLAAAALAAVSLAACNVPESSAPINPSAGYSSVSKLAGKIATGASLEAKDCKDGACTCAGAVDEKVREELGRTAGQLEKGVACQAADFDGNGKLDFVVDVGEGVAVVLFNGEKGVEKTLSLNVGNDAKVDAPSKAIFSVVETAERRWTWAGEGFQYTETPKS